MRLVGQISPLVSIVFSHLLHSFRVCFRIFSTRFECVLVRHAGTMRVGAQTMISDDAHFVKVGAKSLRFVGKITLETSVF